MGFFSHSRLFVFKYEGEIHCFTDGEHRISLKLYQVFAGSLHKPEQYLSHLDDSIRTEYTDQFASTEGNILKHFGIIQNSAFSWLISTP